MHIYRERERDIHICVIFMFIVMYTYMSRPLSSSSGDWETARAFLCGERFGPGPSSFRLHSAKDKTLAQECPSSISDIDMIFSEVWGRPRYRAAGRL